MNFGDLKNVKKNGRHAGGVHIWWRQRLSALFLIVLTLWFFSALTRELANASRASFQLWLAHPWNASLFIFFMGAALYHSNLGLQEIVEDYIHGPFSKTMLQIFLKFMHLFAGILLFLCVIIGAIKA